MHATPAREQLTRSVEDYLKAIYSLSAAGQPATTSDLAAHLGLSAPSVSGMVKRLGEQALLEHVPYRGVQLTDGGRRVALRMVRRHRILEAYLVERLGYGWDEVHEEAERLEHAVSDELIERMAAALGNPGADPHGDPIPSSDGTLDEPAYLPLADVAAGAVVRIGRVAVGEAERLRWIAECGLVPGSTVEVLERQPFEGPITVRIVRAADDDARIQPVGRELARRLLCEPVAEGGR